jgi:hypothetical protein
VHVNDSPRAQLHPAKRAFLGLRGTTFSNWPGPLEINRQIVDLTLDKEMLQELIRRKL